MLGIAQENRQIRELQQENKELCLSLEEHQSALELIMQKYREQIMKLIQSNRVEKSLASRQDQKNRVWTVVCGFLRKFFFFCSGQKTVVGQAIG